MGCALCTDCCGDEPEPEVVRGTLNRERTHNRINMRLTKAGKAEPHEFKEKTFKKKRQCGVCKQNIESLGSFCRVCKTATHKKCESKASVCWGNRTPAACFTREWLIDKSLNACCTHRLTWQTQCQAYRS